MDLTNVLISAAIEVHRDKGPGLFESIYEWCLEKELELRTLSFVSQKAVTFVTRGLPETSRSGLISLLKILS